jgi:hypothetical protein
VEKVECQMTKILKKLNNFLKMLKLKTEKIEAVRSKLKGRHNSEDPLCFGKFGVGAINKTSQGQFMDLYRGILILWYCLLL